MRFQTTHQTKDASSPSRGQWTAIDPPHASLSGPDKPESPPTLTESHHTKTHFTITEWSDFGIENYLIEMITNITIATDCGLR